MSTIILMRMPAHFGLTDSGGKKYGIEIAIGTTPEYNNVLVTALMTRLEFQKGHPALVDGILKALQRSLMLVQCNDPEVIDYAKDKFRYGERAPSALQRANDTHVFPVSIEISEANWMNAAKASAESRGVTFDNSQIDTSKHLFTSIIRPYTDLARKAFNDEVASRFRIEPPSRPLQRINLLDSSVFVFIGMLIGSIVATYHLSMHNIIILSCLLIPLAMTTFMDLRSHPLLHAINWIIWTSIMILSILLLLHNFSLPGGLSVLFLHFPMAFTIFMKVCK